MNASHPRFRDSWLFRIGVALFIAGTGPLLLYGVLYDIGWTTDNNPIGLGLLFFVTFWPSVILIAAGVIAVRRAGRRAKDDALE